MAEEPEKPKECKLGARGWIKPLVIGVVIVAITLIIQYPIEVNWILFITTIAIGYAVSGKSMSLVVAGLMGLMYLFLFNWDIVFLPPLIPTIYIYIIQQVVGFGLNLAISSTFGITIGRIINDTVEYIVCRRE